MAGHVKRYKPRQKPAGSFKNNYAVMVAGKRSTRYPDTYPAFEARLHADRITRETGTYDIQIVEVKES